MHVQQQAQAQRREMHEQHEQLSREQRVRHQQEQLQAQQQVQQQAQQQQEQQRCRRQHQQQTPTRQVTPHQTTAVSRRVARWGGGCRGAVEGRMVHGVRERVRARPWERP